ncbi:MAG: sulfopyruvate decarboxylase subunit alpha [Candidatus Lokiarchaeota archaeon]|nr:sulfopyruvate decarboxylase subunit alpha [Candidatus Lokiarchaeota archaeon]
MPFQTIDRRLYEAIKNSGINLILSVPCAMLKGLIEVINVIAEIPHIPVTREEEGVGIAAGASLAGKTPALLMQNSGLGNSINAIKSLLQLYEIPVIFIMSHRGTEGEKIPAQMPMGQVSIDLLNCVDVGFEIVDSIDTIKNIEKIVQKSRESNKPHGVLLKRTLWRGLK